MAWVFPLFFLAWPVVEIAVLIEIAGWLGWPGAIIGIVLSGMAGVALLRHQGLATAQRAQTQLRQGEMPIGPLFDGACLALAGGLLLLPGFVTDVLALPLLFAPVRLLLRRLLAKRFVVQTRSESAGPAVIEGEWTVVKDEEPRDPDHDQLR